MDEIDATAIQACVYDDQNKERDPWIFCNHSVSRSLILFVTEFCIATLLIFVLHY